MSNSEDRRRTAPSPVPGVPALEKPSRRQRCTSAMPGPRSTASSSTSQPRGERNVCRNSRPCSPYFARLPASSVATRATSARRTSGRSAACASRAAVRRASPTWLGSATATLTWSFIRNGSLPAGDGHARSLAWGGLDLEIVHQPLRARQSQTQTLPRGPPVGEGELEVRNPRPLVDEGQSQPLALAVHDDLRAHDTALPVDDDVAGQLARRGDDLGLIDDAEARFEREPAYALTRHDH